METNKLEPKISIIVPVYKVEPYLHQCIDSILAQTYSNLEVIIVNGVSSDNCGKICDEYAVGDFRVIVLHKPSRGLSDARNAGIDIATGDYLSFIDGDDWVETDMIELLYSNLVEYNADLSMCNFFFSYRNHETPLCDNRKILELDRWQAVKQCFKGENFPVAARGKLYRKEIFDTARYPSGNHCEDVFAIMDVLSKANVIVGETAPKYHYRMRKSSLTKEVYSGFSYKIMDVVAAYEHSLQTAIASIPDAEEFCRAMLIKTNFYVLHIILSEKNHTQLPEYKKILSTLRKEYKFIINSDAFTTKEKIKYSSLKFGVPIYRLLQSIVDMSRKNPEDDRILFD